MSDPDNGTVDPERPRTDKPFNRDTHFTGQDYHRDDEREMGRELPSGSVAFRAPQAGEDDPALPPDNGRRASFDPATGAVRGSGVGAGGGQEGEDMESDTPGGDGPVITDAGTGKP